MKTTLEQWFYNKKHNTIVGLIYNDVRGRWPDGTLIETSKLRPMSMQVSSPKEGVEIFTLNSTYLLGVHKLKRLNTKSNFNGE